MASGLGKLGLPPETDMERGAVLAHLDRPWTCRAGALLKTPLLDSSEEGLCIIEVGD